MKEKILTKKEAEIVNELFAGGTSPTKICDLVGIPASGIYKYLLPTSSVNQAITGDEIVKQDAELSKLKGINLQPALDHTPSSRAVNPPKPDYFAGLKCTNHYDRKAIIIYMGNSLCNSCYSMELDIGLKVSRMRNNAIYHNSHRLY